MNFLSRVISLHLFIFALTFSSFAQTSSFSVKYNQEIGNSKEDIPDHIKEMMKESYVHVDILESKARTSMKQGNMMSSTTIVDSEAKKGIMLLDLGNQKMAIPITEDDYDDFASQDSPKDEEKIIVYNESDTREIAGYKCFKAVANSAQGKVVMYITEDIKASAMTDWDKRFPGLRGFPLYIMSTSNGVEIIMTAESVSTDAPDEEKFEMTVPDGYSESSYQAYQKMYGGRN